jgi:Flp pilus assembly protein TadD
VEIRDAEDLLSRFVCGPEGVELLSMGVVPVSDDRLELEFSGPRSRRDTSGAREIARRVARQQSDVSAFVSGAPPGLALDVQDRWLKEQALELLRDGKPESAASLLVRASQSALARNQRPTFLKGFFLASVRERVSRGDLAGARDELEKLAKLLPADPDLENERGQLLVQRGAFAEARAIYERLTKEAPDNPHGWRNLALTSLMTEDRPTAIRAARRALTLVPYEPELRTLLGRAFYQQGDLREALDHYTRALALDPASAESRVGLALVAQALGHEPPMAIY